MTAPVSKNGFRLVASDLDGTLLRRDKTISGRTRDVIERVVGDGMHFIAVSARPPGIMKAVAREIGAPGLAICANGAIVYDVGRDEVVDHTPLEPDVSNRIVASLREAVPGVCFAVEAGMDHGWEREFVRLIPRMSEVFKGTESDADTLCAAPVSKLIAMRDGMAAEELLAVIRPVVGDTAHATHSGGPWVEMTAAGVNKASALEKLASKLGIPSFEVVAFGDMPNDLPMLAWAGRSIAVANAHPEVIAACDEVTLSNEEDGVAVALEAML